MVKRQLRPVAVVEYRRQGRERRPHWRRRRRRARGPWFWRGKPRRRNGRDGRPVTRTCMNNKKNHTQTASVHRALQTSKHVHAGNSVSKRTLKQTNRQGYNHTRKHLHVYSQRGVLDTHPSEQSCLSPTTGAQREQRTAMAQGTWSSRHRQRTGSCKCTCTLCRRRCWTSQSPSRGRGGCGR